MSTPTWLLPWRHPVRLAAEAKQMAEIKLREWLYRQAQKREKKR